MTDFQAIMADFAVRQAERAAQAQSEIQRLKAAIIDPLRNAEIARVEIRFDGCGDSGAGSRPSRWCNFGCGRGPSSGGFGGDV